jgi:SAM-dependent methyltransferase
MSAVEVLQHPAELERLVSFYEACAPRRVLEIGCWQGGTMREWLSRAHPGTLVVAIDDAHRNATAYGEWAAPGVDVLAFWGKSQEDGACAVAWAHGPYDWIFVDADHAYAAVKADWDLYRPMCQINGGRFLFHDISGGTSPIEEGVMQLWAELKAQGRWRMEEIEDNHGEWGGIGIVTL